MRNENNIRIVRRKLWSMGYHVKLAVPRSDEFDIVVEGMKVRVLGKAPAKFEPHIVTAIVEKGKGSFEGKTAVLYKNNDVFTMNPADLFIKTKPKQKNDKKNKRDSGGGNTKGGDVAVGE